MTYSKKFGILTFSFIMKYLLYIIAFIISLNIAHSQIFNNSTPETTDSTNYPIIKIKPDKIYIKMDTSRFVTRDVKVLNYGDSPLKITKATGSCYCSSVKIMNNVIYPMQVGTLILDINKDGLSPGINTVIFTIVSNSKSSPTFIKAKFVNKNKSDISPKKRNRNADSLEHH